MTETPVQPQPPAPAARRRRILGLSLKIALGLVIVWLIASKLSIDDEVVLDDGGQALRGRDLRVDRTAASLEFRRADGQAESIPLAEDPSLLRRGTEWAVKRQRAPRVPVREPRYHGEVRITVDGTARVFDLQAVRLTAGPEDEGWVEYRLELREGLATIFGRVEAARYVPAMLLMLGLYLIGIKRWQILLRAQGIGTSYWEAGRLTFIGFFFNNLVPGLTGGDLVKAIMIARAHPGRGAVAVSTVIVDRVLGLLVLAAISAVFLAFNFSDYRTVALWLFIMLGSGLVGIALFLSRRIRRAFRINALLKKMPGARALMQLDEAFLLYRSRGRAVLQSVALSIGAHLLNILSIYLMGLDLGVDRSGGLEGEPLVTYFAIVPTILIASSVPLLPGGWGLGEWLFATFFRTVGVTNLSLSVGLSVLTRASALLWSLAGGVFLFLERREARDALHHAESLTPGSDGATPG